MPSSPPATLASPTSSSSHSDAPPTHRRQRVTAEHTLSRVRENQRRHRARRKDYIASLEQKLAEAEKQLAEARAEIEALKAERDAHGIKCKSEETEQSALVEEVAREASEEGQDGSVDKAPEALQLDLSTLTPTSIPDLQDASFLGSFYMTDTLIPFSPSSLPSDIPLDLTVPSVNPDLNPSNPPLPTGPPPCCEPSPALPPPDPSDPECSSCKQRPAPALTESTTLCAQAYVMIQQQNFRGIDAATIRLWLIQGFRRAQRQGEGCRVENGALFRLLDYISGI